MYTVVSRTDSIMELHFLLLSFTVCENVGHAVDNPTEYDDEDPYILTSNDVQEILHAHLIFDVNA